MLVIGSVPCPFDRVSAGERDTEGGPRRLPLEEAHLRETLAPRRPAAGALVALSTLVCLALLLALPAHARAGVLQKDRAKATELAGEVSALDARIGAAVQQYAQATQALDAVRAQIAENKRLQVLSHRQLDLARAILVARAVAMYKHEDVSAIDVIFRARSMGDFVTDLRLLRELTRSDRDVLRTISTSERELADRAKALRADEATQRELVGTIRDQLTTIRGRLEERRSMLAGVRADIRDLAAKAEKRTPTPAPTATVEPPQPGGGGGGTGGSGPWWSLIQSAAAGNGVSARGMYRLMMIESGGSSAAVGPGGYYGLFQYAPSTWKGSWNPWRTASITDGAAQIKATALALHLGYGHAWWDPSYTWAFQGN